MPGGYLGILAVRELKTRQRRSFVSQENEMLAITAIIRVKKGCETAMRELDVVRNVRAKRTGDRRLLHIAGHDGSARVHDIRALP